VDKTFTLSPGKISSFVNRFGFRLRFLTLADGISRILLVLSVQVIIANYLAGPLSETPFLRLTITSLIGAVCLYFTAKYLLILVFQRATPLNVARFLAHGDKQSSEPGSRLLNAIELAGVARGESRGLSRELMSQYYRQIEQTLDFKQLYRSASSSLVLKQFSLIAVVTMLLALSYSANPQQFFDRQTRYFNFDLFPRDHVADIADEIQKAPTPLVGDINLTYHYPRYTGLAAKTEMNSSGDIMAIKGTTVEIEAYTNRPVEKAFIETAGQKLPLQLQERMLKGELTLIETGSYCFVVTDEEGKEHGDPVDHRIDVLSDYSPQVDIIEPTSDLEANDLQLVRIIYKASDDFGLIKTELVYRDISLGTAEKRIVIDSFENPPLEAGGSYDWQLASLELEPGAEVIYRLDIYDNDEVSGPKVTSSRSFRIKIKSALEEHQQLLGRLEQYQDGALNYLADLLEDPVQAQADGRQFGSTVTRRTRQFSSLVEELRLLKEAFADDIYADKTTADGLESVLGRQKKIFKKRSLAERQNRSALTLPRTPTVVRSLFRSRENEEISEFESDIIFIENLLARERMGIVSAMVREMKSKQEELGELIRKMKEGGLTAAEKEKIMEKIARIENMMREIAAEMAANQRTMPDEFINAEALKKNNSDQPNMANELEELKQALEDGDIDKLLEKAEQLMQQTTEMMSKMDNSAATFGERSFSDQQAEMPKFEEKLSELREEQKKLLEQTEKLEQEVNEYRNEQQRMREEEVFEQLEEKANALRGKYRHIKRNSTRAPVTRRATGMHLNHLDRFTAQLKRNLTQKDTQRALESANAVAGQFGILEAKAKNVAERFEQAENRRTEIAEKASEGAGIAWEIAELLRELKAGIEPSPQQQQQMQQLSEKQQQLEQQTAELMQKFEQIAPMAPFLPQEARDEMAEAADKMKQAGEQLQDNSPAPAAEHQREADFHLEAAQQQISEAMQKMQQAQQMPQMQPQPMPSGSSDENNQRLANPSASDVEIPGADQYSVPEHYRREILEAIKEKGPSRYRELNNDYYERLIR
jgi:Domain of unknown function (DUF4175)